MTLGFHGRAASLCIVPGISIHDTTLMLWSTLMIWPLYGYSGCLARGALSHQAPRVHLAEKSGSPAVQERKSRRPQLSPRMKSVIIRQALHSVLVSHSCLISNLCLYALKPPKFMPSSLRCRHHRPSQSLPQTARRAARRKKPQACSTHLEYVPSFFCTRLAKVA